MELDKTNLWLSLVANMGVIAGLIFLGVEISQNTQMMRSSMTQNRAETAMDQAVSIYTSEYMPRILVEVRAGETLNPEDQLRFATYLRAFNRNQDNILQQYLEGLLSDTVLRSIRSAVLIEVARNHLPREVWESSKIAYTNEYIELVDDVIQDFCASNTCLRNSP